MGTWKASDVMQKSISFFRFVFLFKIFTKKIMMKINAGGKHGKGVYEGYMFFFIDYSLHAQITSH